jgi:hypothetical protein
MSAIIMLLGCDSFERVRRSVSVPLCLPFFTGDSCDAAKWHSATRLSLPTIMRALDPACLPVGSVQGKAVVLTPILLNRAKRSLLPGAGSRTPMPAALTFTPTHAPTTARHAQRSVFVFLRAVPTMFDPRTASALRACGAVEATGVPRTIWPRVASPVNPSGRPSWRPS